jgi:hypothetical protein
VFKARRAFIAVLVCCGLSAAVALPASAATTIGVAPDTGPHGTFQAQCYWSATVATFGQTITVPEGDNVLDRFSFYLVENKNALNGSPLGPQTVTYKAYVYEWDAAGNRAVGPALWQSPAPQVVTTSSDFQEVVAETGGVQLQSGVQYVIFLSMSETSGSNDPGAGACFMHPATGYSGGAARILVHGTDTSLWTGQAWLFTGDEDFAFGASFSTPAGGGGEEPIYDFDGFFAPVNNKDAQGNYILNRVNAGAAVPVKFSLGGDYGLDVFEAGYPRSEDIGCDSQAEVDGVEQTVNAGSSSLSYAAGSDTYTYVWKTDGAWEDTCRQLVVMFNDGTTARANFTFH